MSMSPPTLETLMPLGERVGRKYSQMKSNASDEEAAPSAWSASKALTPGAPLVLHALCPGLPGETRWM